MMNRNERWAWERGKQIFSYLTEMRSVGTVTGYELNSKGSNPTRGKSFLFSTASRPALGPTLLPIQLISGVSFPGLKLTTQLHLVAKSSMMELYFHSPHMSSWWAFPSLSAPPRLVWRFSNSFSLRARVRQTGFPAVAANCKLRRLLALCRQIPEQ
jgi:hypothetical protein